MQNESTEIGLHASFETLSDFARLGGVWLAVIFVAWLANFITKQVLVRAVQSLVKRTKTTWDDIFVEHGVFTKLSHLAPALVFYFAAHLLFPQESDGRFAELVQRLATVWMVFAGGRAANSFINGLVDIGQRSEGTRNKPIRSYAQVAALVLWLGVGIVAVATLMDKSPWALLTGLGALTAVLMLVFKDSILGFVASVQIANNDMVRRGDWIEMPSFGADGDVIEIGLHTVKVQNWDKTVSTIPTPAFLNDTFKNWRGMTESGGRRIKRSLAIDVNSVRFLSEEDVKRLEQIQLLAPYLEEHRAEVDAWNSANDVDPSSPANGRRLTNLGSLRAYIEKYLAANSNIRADMTFLVRQLPPSSEGIPLEIYVFSGEQRWVQYESVVADIFDHLLAVLPEFGLRAFQRPSGADLAGLRI